MKEKIEGLLLIIGLNSVLFGTLIISQYITVINPQPPYSVCIDKYCMVSILTSNAFLLMFEWIADLYILFFPLIIMGEFIIFLLLFFNTKSWISHPNGFGGKL